ncbi:MAG: RsmD family RNA methyltransferase [Bacteroidales bacterium]|nr:RsmD family RNA methyltransferase [Bacteroidales bacterium]
MTHKERQLIQEYKSANVHDLALRLRNSDDVSAKYVVQQIQGLQIMQRKVPFFADNPDVEYPEHLPLEQCSSSFTAGYKCEVMNRLLSDYNHFTDLTGGFGVDFFFLSEKFQKAVYNERNADLCHIVSKNFAALKRTNAVFQNADGVEFIKKSTERFNLIFIDPARRNSAGKKTVLIEDCEPDILEFQDIMIQKSDFVMIKLSPMADIADCLAKLHNVREIHIVATDNECKEILIVLQQGYTNEPKIFTINDKERYSFLLSSERECAAEFYQSNDFQQKYLFEPNASVMKSGAFKILTKDFPIQKLHPSSHLYIADSDVYNFPGRRFRIVSIGSPKDFGDIKTANLAVRNFPEKAEALKRKLKIKDGGNIFLFATTLFNTHKVIIQCVKC